MAKELRGSGAGRRAFRGAVLFTAIGLASVSAPLAATAAPALNASTPVHTGDIFNAGGVPPLTPNATWLANNGTLYASDEEGTRIVTVDPVSGNVTEVSPASQGWSHPSGMYLMKDQQHLWVADKDNSRVVEVDVNRSSATYGQIIKSIGSLGAPQSTGVATFNAPETLTMDSAETALYVADTYNYRVAKVDANPSSPTFGNVLWSQNAATGAGTGCNGTKLLRMRGIVFGTGGTKLFVGDTDQGRVVAMDPATGSCLRTIGAKGKALGQFGEPRGIDSDGKGGLWVADNSNARITYVTETGTGFWNTATTFGSGVNQLRSPHGVQLRNGTLYVSDTYNYRLVLYPVTSTGTTLGTATYVNEPLPAPGGFDAPYGVTYDGSGNLYVVDHFNSRVEKFNGTGGFVTQWGGEGTPLGSFNFPRGIVMTPNGNVLVCDSENHRMQTFTPSGALVPHGQIQVVGAAPFLRPQQIWFAQDGTLWVADTNNKRVINVDTSGNVIPNHVWSNPAPNFTPRGIVTDAAGNVYVADNTRSVVEEYSPTGTLLFTLASHKAGLTQVAGPDGMWIVGNTLYIADTNDNRVLMIDTSGNFINTFGSLGKGSGQFIQPYFVAVGPSGQIAVSDLGNNRISLWQG